MPRSSFARSKLFHLPLELRQQIYTFVLPSNKPSNDISDGGWTSGSVTILRASRQIYAEAIAVLFAKVTFHIRIEQDCVLFIKTYHYSDGRILKVPLSVRYAFPEALGRNLWRVQRVAIQIEMGIMNVWGFIVNTRTDLKTMDQLNAYQGQMEMLCISLRRMERIRLLHICASGLPVPAILILRPLTQLSHVDTVSWEGNVPEELRQATVKRIENSWARNSFLRLPPEVRNMVYQYLLPCHRILLFRSQLSRKALHSGESTLDLDQQPPIRENRGYTAILRTCRKTNDEARRVLYANNIFRIMVHDLVEPICFDSLRADVVRIGASNFGLIRRFELATRRSELVTQDRRSQYDQWGDAFTRLVQDNPHIESVICRESRASRACREKRTIEVPRESALRKKGLRHIDFLPVRS